MQPCPCINRPLIKKNIIYNFIYKKCTCTSHLLVHYDQKSNNRNSFKHGNNIDDLHKTSLYLIHYDQVIQSLQKALQTFHLVQCKYATGKFKAWALSEGNLNKLKEMITSSIPKFGAKNRLKKSKPDPDGPAAHMIKPLPGNFLISSSSKHASITSSDEGKTT